METIIDLRHIPIASSAAAAAPERQPVRWVAMQAPSVPRDRETTQIDSSPAGTLEADLATPAPAWIVLGAAPGALRQEPLDHLAVNVGEAEAATLEFERQLLVVDAQKVQQGGLEVVDVDLVLAGI